MKQMTKKIIEICKEAFFFYIWFCCKKFQIDAM